MLTAKQSEQKCCSHYITTRAVRALLLDTIRTVSAYAISDEKGFVEKIRAASQIQQDNAAKELKRKLNRDRKRSSELNGLIKKLYESYATGKLTEKRFEILSAEYEREQEVDIYLKFIGKFDVPIPEPTPEELANKISYDLAMSLTKGNHAFIVCTHVDKHHIHSHIVFNSTALSHGCKDFDSFLAAMKAEGVEVKQGKYLAFKIPNGKRFVRCDSLGDDYSEAAILERISGKRIVAPKAKVAAPTKPNMLIDIQARMQQAHSPGFEHWAKIFNLKEMAKTVMYLQEHGLTDLRELEKACDVATQKFNSLTDRSKAISARLKKISELQRHIGIYLRV